MVAEGAPPENGPKFDCIPEGCQPNGCWHPSGMQKTYQSFSGGVASLNHRLIAENPPG